MDTKTQKKDSQSNFTSNQNFYDDSDYYQDDDDTLTSEKMRKKRKLNLTPEQKRIYKIEEKIYTWSRVLTVFAGIAMAFSGILLIVDLLLGRSYQDFISYEIGTTPLIFKYANEKASVFIDFNEKVIGSCIQISMILFISIFIQGFTCFKTLRPLVNAIQKKQLETKKQMINQDEITQANIMALSLVGEDVLRVNGSSHDQTKHLQKIMFLFSVMNFAMMIYVQINLYNEVSGVVYKWVDDNVDAQIFDSSRSPTYISGFKDAQRVSTKRYAFIIMIYFNLMAFAVFTTINAFILYGAHQLSRNQKKTEED
ncbi:UNKNOWN [Stylonychia lemnae]|uniref:Transmembrane protein n=1 Tax=Stylonychia lemnae TaxID=5949 RepID=A0A078A5L5_STYLE|nr:UNKNOWN [Stylonychia lemnae]|eukprot:CDW77469.1 UNKNOWN [Stylonychia lemnae]